MSTAVAYAWQQLGTLIISGCGTVADAGMVSRCMADYAHYVAGASRRFTWESVCCYHLRATGPIFSKGAVPPSVWTSWDSGRFTSLLVPLAPKAPAKAASKAVASARSVRPKAAKDTSSEVCRLYNTQLCLTKTCPRGRRHVCSSCGKGHPVAKCSA